MTPTNNLYFLSSVQWIKKTEQGPHLSFTHSYTKLLFHKGSVTYSSVSELPEIRI
jgi:hypothetical protein